MSYVENPFAEREAVRDFYSTHAAVVRDERALEQAWIKHVHTLGCIGTLPRDGHMHNLHNGHYFNFRLGNGEFRLNIGDKKAVGSAKDFYIVEVIGHSKFALGGWLHEYKIIATGLTFELPVSE